MSINIFAFEEQLYLKNTNKCRPTFSDVQYISTVRGKYCVGLYNGFEIFNDDGIKIHKEITKQGVSVCEMFEDGDRIALVGNGKEFWTVEESKPQKPEPDGDDLSFLELNQQDEKSIVLNRDKIFIWSLNEKKRVRTITIANPILGLRIHSQL